MDPQMQGGGTQFSLESLMTPNFIYFVVTLAVIGYLYQTKMILGREHEVKSQSANLFDKQMYLEIGFMILIGFCMYIFNNNENTTFVWIYMLVPILYLVMKSLLVFNKVTNFLEQAPVHTDVNTDIVDLINANKNNNNNNINNTVIQVPVTNQNSNHQIPTINSQLHNALGVNNNNKGMEGMNPPIMPQFGNNSPEGFSLF